MALFLRGMDMCSLAKLSNKMYEHDIKKLMNYGSSLGITLDIPNDIEYQ